MSDDQPSANNRPAARIEAFLGRATSFMAIYGASDPTRLGQLAIIADQLGLTNQEYQAALQQLREQREVVITPKVLPRTLPTTPGESEPPTKEPPSARCVLTASDPLRDSFLQQAKLLLASANSETPEKLRKLAAKLGVDDDQFERWLSELHGPFIVAEAVPEPAAEAEAVATKEPAPPKIERKPPQEMYEDYLHLALGAISSGRINQRRETKLIAEGVEKLGLSSILARDMLYAAAERRSYVLLSQLTEPSEAPVVDEKREQTITAFQQRAASIIAGQGGVSSVCRVMIAEAAAQFGLSKAEKEQALSALQRQVDSRLADPLEERIAAFRRFACDKLKNTESRIVGDLLTKQLTQIGVDLHGLPEETAAVTVREAITTEALHVVTLDQAVTHVLSIVDDLLADEGFISIENRKRLLAEARQWGVARAEASMIIEEHIANIEHRAKRRRRRIFASVLMSTLTLFGGLALVYWGKPEWANFGQGANVWNSDPSARAGIDPLVDPTLGEEEFQRVSWWNEALTIDLLALRRRRTDLQPATAAIAKEEPQLRAEGYAEFIPKMIEALAEESNATHAEQLRVIMRRLAIDEPDDAAFQTLTQAILKQIPAKDGALHSKSRVDQQYVALGLLIDVARQRELAAQRHDQIVTQLEQRLGVVTGPAADLAAVFADELARNQYAALGRLVEKDPAEAMATHPLLQRVVSANVNRQLAGDLDGDALLAILPRVPQDLNSYRSVLDRQISQRNLAVLLRLIELLESGKTNGRVASELQALLAKVADVTVDGMESTDAAIVMRSALAGLAGQGDVGEMARFFAGAAHKIELSESEFGSPDEWLNDAVELSRISALGAAAAQKESGRRLFQSLSSDIPEPIRAAKAGARRVVSQDRAERIREAFRQLSRANDPRRRVMAYENLAAIISGSDDLDYYHAERLVDYLILKKLGDEHDAVIRKLSDFRASSMLRLALSDHLDESIMPVSEMERLAGEIVGRPVILDKSIWKDELRRILLSDALPRLNDDAKIAGEDVSGDVLEQSAASLLDYYRIQAEIAGVPYEQRMVMRLPSDALQAMIQLQADQLAAAKLSPDLQSQLEDVLLRYRVVTLVAHNDLTRTAALQRIWLELSAIAAVRAQPNSRLATDQLIARLRQVDQGAQNVFQQIRNGEAALVRMQLIRIET